ncbi:MAG: NAD-dependent epimerase/dehydratase family protein [Deltaproteobacteria bacterium]|nr:NAD-dependent epimerase/dehydratase family protein [Deltaproteobacteria bacterium]
MKGKRVLLTGAGGFIGSHLLEALVQEGATVRAFVRYNSRGERGLLDELPVALLREVEVCAGDLRDPDAVLRAVAGCEVVFHLAALIAIPYSYVHPMDFVQTNVVGTANLLNAACFHGIGRLVHTSTSETYGTARYVPMDEAHPANAQSPYAASKVAADALALSYQSSFRLPVVVVRPFNAYGPRQSARAVIPAIVTQLLGREVLELGNLAPTRDFTYVTDHVAGFLAAADTPGIEGRVFNLGNGKEISIGDLARRIMAVVGRQLPIASEEVRLRPDASEVQRLLCDARQAREVLGWQPVVGLDEGLALTVASIRARLSRYRAGSYAI